MDVETTLRVFLVDDHDIVRDGLRALLEPIDDIDVVGEAGTASTALARIPLADPDVVVLDVHLPDASGIEVCRELRDQVPETRVLFLSSFGDDEAVLDAVLAGAHGYAMKHIARLDLVDAIRKVAAGHALIDPVAAARVRDRAAHGDITPSIGSLTGQERRLLDLLAEGLTNREIADRLHLSDKTVKNYVSSLLMKLGMARRSEAAAFAARIDERRHAYRDAMGDLLPVRY